MEPTTGISIKDHFSALSDPRILRKTRHKLVDVIVIALCAVIAGADDWVEIAAFGKEKEQWFKTFLELPGGIPSHDTFGRVFSLINPEEIASALSIGFAAPFRLGSPTLSRSMEKPHGALMIVSMANRPFMWSAPGRFVID